MDTIDDSIAAIERWLLGPKVQIAEGLHGGGVPGWLGADNEPVFIYPEITGYFLTWLTFLAEKTGDCAGLGMRAAEAIDWIARHYSEEAGPATRVYLIPGKERDWRNNGIFSFDLAMIARGLQAARSLVDTEVRQRTHSRVIALLATFCRNNNSLDAVKPISPDAAAAIPRRWSSLSGPHQLKAAAAILSAHPDNALPVPLHSTFESEYRSWRDHPIDHQNHDEPHPAFYHMEGLAIAAVNGLDPDARDIAADAYMRVLGMKSPSARLAKRFSGSALECRSDVLAQALRMGSLIRSHGPDHTARLDQMLEHLYSTLRSFFTQDGAILFSKTAPVHKNVWSAMFAHQALSFFQVVRQGHRIPEPWIYLLV